MDVKEALASQIYIPIWLDLLCEVIATADTINAQFTFQYGQIYYARASNKYELLSSLFTFQYGQIYYRLKNKYKFIEYEDLHSNMVRFII